MAVKKSLVLQIARSVRQIRKQAHLSRVDLAKLAGVGKTAIFDIEHEKPTVQFDTLLKVLHALNIKLDLRPPIPVTEAEDEKG